MAFVPDFEEHFLRQRFSDVIVVIQDETEALGKRKRDKTLPAHSMVLMAFSMYFRTKLQSWSETDAASSDSTPTPRFEVALPVPAGQRDLAELLIKGIYQKQPNVTADLSHAQLLQLLLLADRFEVPKVQATVLQAFSQLQAEQLQWQTALDLLGLPAVCAEQPEQFKTVQDFAVKRLLHELGDLEAAWGSEQKQQLLLGLPFAALKQLLQHPETRVASENTVVYTVERWYQQPPAQQRTVDQLKQLMQLVRLPHCSPYYISTIMAQSELVTQCFSQLELAAALHCRSDPDALAAYQQARIPLLKQSPAWAAAQRPASNRQQAIVWHLPLRELKSAVEEFLQDSTARKFVHRYSSSHILKGQQLAIKVGLTKGNSSTITISSAGRQFLFGVHTVCQQLPRNAVVKISAKITVAAVETAAPCAPQQRSPPDIVAGPFPVQALSSARFSYGYYDLLGPGKLSSWEATEKVLRAKQLVHPAGHEGQAEPHLSIRADLLQLE